jgi:PadR family transcriptional regulator AphA
VLGVIGEGPTHGFAVATLLAEDGAVGQVWTVARPLVYRELDQLTRLRLVAERDTQRSEQGPNRTIVEITEPGQVALRDWLGRPVQHVRDVRSLLLLKLALLTRAGADPRPLLHSQREQFLPQVHGLAAVRDQADGFERLLAQWRLANSRAVLDFLDAALSDHPPG